MPAIRNTLHSSPWVPGWEPDKTRVVTLAWFPGIPASTRYNTRVLDLGEDGRGENMKRKVKRRAKVWRLVA